MHVNVREFLNEDVGYRRTFEITGERPPLEGITLTDDINGDVTISRIDDGLLVSGVIHAEIELVCDRCLRSFTRPERIQFEWIYREKPEDDDLPIVKDKIDLAPIINQELILAQPIKQLHSPDCAGVDGKPDNEPAPAPSLRVGDRARITKG
ncbi:DUF177 domain-containing protein [Candidatus Saccharibacteria bacterium]|nr:DUF177 domain-containing protein [Candidatus Saccharibacteria bacterium]